VSTEAIVFIPASQNRTGRPLVVAAHEVSGTVAVFTADNAATTSVTESAVENGVRVSTLSASEFALDIPTFGADAVQISITDIAGASLQDVVFTGTAQLPSIRHTVDFTGKASGAYIVTMRCGARTLVHKLTVQR
jgi:hypothetical protein